MSAQFGGVVAGHPLERLVDQRVVAPGLDPADLAQHGRGVAALGAGERPDRQAAGGVGEIGDGDLGQPAGDHAAGPADERAERASGADGRMHARRPLLRQFSQNSS